MNRSDLAEYARFLRQMCGDWTPPFNRYILVRWLIPIRQWCPQAEATWDPLRSARHRSRKAMSRARKLLNEIVRAGFITRFKRRYYFAGESR